MSDDLDARFKQASDEVTQLSEAPDNLAKLKLYAMFKQASAGDCAGSRPGMLDFVARAKYDKWKELEGTPQDEAKRQYIEFVEELKAADKAK